MGTSIKAEINWVGIPFKWGGHSFSGIDCAGLMRLFLKKELGLRLPRDFGPHSLESWIKYSEHYIITFLNKNAIKVEYPRFGDIVVLHVRGGAAHIGVMLDHERFLHIYYNQTSSISRVDSFGKHRLIGYWRVMK